MDSLSVRFLKENTETYIFPAGLVKHGRALAEQTIYFYAIF